MVETREQLIRDIIDIDCIIDDILVDYDHTLMSKKNAESMLKAVLSSDEVNDLIYDLMYKKAKQDGWRNKKEHKRWLEMIGE